MTTTAPSPHLPIRPEWLASRPEPVLEPALPIVDPHHHLWNRDGNPYLLPDLLADITSGHAVQATVFIECRTHYRQGGDPYLAPLGETEFAAAAGAACAAGPQASAGACAGIVGHVDLRAGARATELLQAQVEAGGGRFRGIRHSASWHPDPAAKGSSTSPPPGLYLDPDFRAGFACLAPLGLSFDAWMLHTQLAELRDLADAFPETTIILDHVGGPLNIGPYVGRQGHVMAEWGASMRSLAALPNVHVKLGGFGMRLFNCACYDQALPPSSEELAEAWRPYIETAVAAFGPGRCMFESNFPVDKGACSYVALWNAYKRVTAGWLADERAALFSGTARRVYRLPG
jgi:predicted TIM-barrel fold metal-dependent hydrolase